MQPACRMQTSSVFKQVVDIERQRGLRHEPSSLARTLGLWVRIPLEAWVYVGLFCVCVVLCVGSGLATD
jgi:hypothetical protein